MPSPSYSPPPTSDDDEQDADPGGDPEGPHVSQPEEEPPVHPSEQAATERPPCAASVAGPPHGVVADSPMSPSGADPVQVAEYRHFRSRLVELVGDSLSRLGIAHHSSEVFWLVEGELMQVGPSQWWDAPRLVDRMVDMFVVQVECLPHES